MYQIKYKDKVYDHHVYNNSFKVKEKLERNSMCNRNSIIVNSNKVAVVHVPETLTVNFFSLMESWRVQSVTALITGEKIRFSEETSLHLLSIRTEDTQM